VFGSGAFGTFCNFDSLDACGFFADPLVSDKAVEATAAIDGIVIFDTSGFIGKSPSGSGAIGNETLSEY
jgi:hypothetical protein